MGLFDQLGQYYTREGAGIYKNAPGKKSPVRRFFEIFGRKFWSLMKANLMYILLKLPFVTGGLADAGLTYVTRNAARERFAYPVSDFFSTVKRSFKRAFPAGLINLVIWSVFLFNTYFYVSSLFFRTDGTTAPSTHWLMLGINSVGMLLFSFMNYYISFMIITFELSLKQIYKNAFLFSLHNLKNNFIIFGSLLLTLLVVFVPFLFMDYRIWLCVLALGYILIYPAYRSLLIQHTIFPYMKKVMIDPYYKEHPEADRSVMRFLNLDLEEDTDAVFKDGVETE